MFAVFQFLVSTNLDQRTKYGNWPSCRLSTDACQDTSLILTRGVHNLGNAQPFFYSKYGQLWIVQYGEIVIVGTDFFHL